MCSVRLFVFSSQFYFVFFYPHSNFFFHFYYFYFLLFKSLFYYWAQSCNSLSWRHLCLTYGTMLKSQFRQPFKYLMLRICFNILCNITSAFEICCDFSRDVKYSASFLYCIRSKWFRTKSAMEWYLQVGKIWRIVNMLSEHSGKEKARRLLQKFSLYLRCLLSLCLFNCVGYICLSINTKHIH
jgi:hypothetical protein